MTDTTSSDVSMKKDHTMSSVSSDGAGSEFNDMDTKSSVSEPKGTSPSSVQELARFLFDWDSTQSNTITLSYTDQLPSNSESMEKRGVQFAIVGGHVHATFPVGFEIKAETTAGRTFCYSFLQDGVQIGQLVGNPSNQTLKWRAIN